MNQIAQGGAPAALSELDSVFERIISVAIGLAGIALFIMLVVGGFKFLTAGGDPKKLDSARSTITMAIGGLILLLISYFILIFIGNITGTDLTQFTIVRGQP